MSIDINKIVFIALTEMMEYCGIEKNQSGGGGYIDQNGYGHELYNFRADHGHCYGYAAPYGKTNLHNITNDISHDNLGAYIDNVLVVFTGTRKGSGRIIVGWYKNARIYADIVNDERESRYLDIIKGYVGYNIICDAQDAMLINYADRSFVIPHSRVNDGVGHGHHNIWYASKPKDIPFKEDVIAYIHNFDSAFAQNDEFKYHLHDESKKYVSTSTQLNRSRKARRECIDIYGCHCDICGFDFEGVYGDTGKDYIEVHHITPVGELSSAEGYEGTNPKDDLIPLCSNCHSMVHRRKIPYKPDEIRMLLKEENRHSHDE